MWPWASYMAETMIWLGWITNVPGQHEREMLYFWRDISPDSRIMSNLLHSPGVEMTWAKNVDVFSRDRERTLSWMKRAVTVGKSLAVYLFAHWGIHCIACIFHKFNNRPVSTDSNSRAYLGRDSDHDPNKRDYFYFYVWGQKSRDY